MGAEVGQAIPGRRRAEGGVLKAACPECGYVSEMSEFASVIAYVCEGCGEGIDVERFIEEA